MNEIDTKPKESFTEQENANSDMFGERLDAALDQRVDEEKRRRGYLAGLREDVDMIRSQGRAIKEIASHPEHVQTFMSQGKMAFLFIGVIFLFIALVVLSAVGILPKIVVRVAALLFAAVAILVDVIKKPKI